MTNEQFWQSSFADLALRTEAYRRNARPAAMYFREMFCLLYNINRSEKAPALEPMELMMLHGEKVPRQPRRQKSLMDDPVAFADYMARINAMSKRENEESALFDLLPADYLRRRAGGEITVEMVEYLMRKKYFEENPDAAADSFVMPIISNPQSSGAPPPFPLNNLVNLRRQIEAERNLGTEHTPEPVTSVEVANPVPAPAIESESESEPETRADANSFVPPGLTGEPIPIQPSQWD